MTTRVRADEPVTLAGRETSTVDGQFRRNGREHRILSGSLHYSRVHPDLWADRLRTLVGMGLNTVDTYVPWNFHQQRPGQTDFTDWRDLPRFINLAEAAGLDVIVRPGPYICGEWDNGGLPAWLQFDGPMPVRCSDSRFLAAVGQWFDELIPRIASLQASAGGPVVAVQVENEYGSYGDDAEYLRWLHSALIERGLNCLLYTADGPTPQMLDTGSIPGVLATATFGSRPAEAFGMLTDRHPDDPVMCSEFWNGWFDHWGEQHHVRSPDSAVSALEEMLRLGGSVNLYMVHGGTNFGLWSGANFADGKLQPTVTSYDSDAPIAEDGCCTDKYRQYRTLLAPLTGSTAVPAEGSEPHRLTSRQLRPHRTAELLTALRGIAGPPVSAPVPQTMEQLRQSSGLVLYSARSTLPPTGALRIDGLADRAQVYLDGLLAGTLDRNEPDGQIELTGLGRPVELDLVVENQGRINYGSRLGEGKGILGGVLLNRSLVHGWQSRSIDLQELDAPEFDPSWPAAADGGPQLAGFTVEIDQPADGFLALPGWAKGFVWLNGFLLGRYWEIGPQRTLYVPAPLWRAGDNDIVVLELERGGTEIALLDGPELGPAQEYVESF